MTRSDPVRRTRWPALLLTAAGLLAVACEAGDEAFLREMVASYFADQCAKNPVDCATRGLGGKAGNKNVDDLFDLKDAADRIEAEDKARQAGEDAKKLTQEAKTDDERKKALAKYDEAIDGWPKGTKLTAEQAQQLRERAALRASLGQTQDARDDLDRAVGLNPSDPAIRLQRAELNKKDNPDKALLDYDAARRNIEKRDDIDDASKGLKVGNIERARAQVLAGQGKTQDALQALYQAGQAYNASAGGPPKGFYVEQAEVRIRHANQGGGAIEGWSYMYAAAADDFRQASQADPRDTTLPQREAEARFSQAAAVMPSGYSGSPNPRQEERNLALAGTLDAAQRAQGANPNSPAPHQLQGQALSAAGHDREWFGQAAEARTAYGQAASAYAQAAQRSTTDGARAVNHLQQGESLLGQARTGGGQEGYRQALEALDQAQTRSFALSPGWRAQIQFNRAQVLRGLGRAQEADAALAEARRLNQ